MKWSPLFKREETPREQEISLRKKSLLQAAMPFISDSFAQYLKNYQRFCLFRTSSLGVPLRCHQLRIWHCHCSSLGHCSGRSSVPGPGTSTCHEHGQKKRHLVFYKLLEWNNCLPEELNHKDVCERLCLFRLDLELNFKTMESKKEETFRISNALQKLAQHTEQGNQKPLLWKWSQEHTNTF